MILKSIPFVPAQAGTQKRKTGFPLPRERAEVRAADVRCNIETNREA
jgi:hypothetical protein